MSEKRIIFLMDRYLENNCLPEERKELIQLINSGNFDHIIQSKIGDGLLDNADRKLDFAATESVWNEIQSAQSQTHITPVRSINSMPRWIWVAAGILVLFTSGWFWLQSQKIPEPKIVMANNNLASDLPPGHNGAVLTLSDGSQIVLDSVGNGTIASQNGTKVVWVDGQLAYNPSEMQVAQIVYNTMATPKGRMFNMVLPDGTSVWLNSESTLKYPTVFSGKERRVELKGEGYFEVKPNKEMPFIVMANHTNVEVLGTHFNVNAYPEENEVKTTLLEGSVKVSNGDKSVLIVPGEQVSSGNTSNVLRVKNDLNTDAVVAWKNGKFYFDNVDINTIMNEVARWYDVEVEYKGKITKIFGGTISRNISASNVFKILEATGGVRFTIEGKKVIVEPAK